MMNGYIYLDLKKYTNLDLNKDYNVVDLSDYRSDNEIDGIDNQSPLHLTDSQFNELWNILRYSNKPIMVEFYGYDSTLFRGFISNFDYSDSIKLMRFTYQNFGDLKLGIIQMGTNSNNIHYITSMEV